MLSADKADWTLIYARPRGARPIAPARTGQAARRPSLPGPRPHERVSTRIVESTGPYRGADFPRSRLPGRSWGRGPGRVRPARAEPGARGSERSRPRRTCVEKKLLRALGEGVAGLRVAAVVAGAEPLLPLGGGAVGEGVRVDAAAGLLLDRVVADGAGGVQALLDVLFGDAGEDRSARRRRRCRWRSWPRRRRSSRPAAPSAPRAGWRSPGRAPAGGGHPARCRAASARGGRTRGPARTAGRTRRAAPSWSASTW